MPPSFHLYGNRDSGHSYKVALALRLAGERFAHTAVDLDTPRGERPEDFRAVSRYGEVPVLLIDGVPHCQSDAILLRLTEIVPALGHRERGAIREWLFWEANRIGFSVPNLRLMLHWQRDAPRELVDWLRARARLDLGRLDAELQDKAFLLGASWSVADLACAGYLFWPEHIDIALSDYRAVTTWLERIRALPGWQHPYDLMR